MFLIQYTGPFYENDELFILMPSNDNQVTNIKYCVQLGIETIHTPKMQIFNNLEERLKTDIKILNKEYRISDNDILEFDGFKEGLGLTVQFLKYFSPETVFNVAYYYKED